MAHRQKIIRYFDKGFVLRKKAEARKCIRTKLKYYKLEYYKAGSLQNKLQSAHPQEVASATGLGREVG